MLIDKAYESHLSQDRGRHGLIHVAGSGIPPWASAIKGRHRCTSFVEATLA
jgi:hypothetical protein